MADTDKIQLLLEAEKRGILPPDKAPLLAEARSRGLIPSLGPSPAAGSQYAPGAAAAIQPVASAIGRQLGLTGRTVVSGLMTIPTAFGDAINQGINYGVEGVNALTGSNITPPMRPTSEVTQDSLTRAGLPAPETPIEKGVNIAGQMITSGPSVAGGAKLLETAGVKGLSTLANDVTGLSGMFRGGAPKAGATPTTQAIKDASQAAYKASENAGLIIKPQVMQDLAGNMKTKLADYAFDPEDQPMVGRALNSIVKAGDENITLKGVDTLRKKLVNIITDGTSTERMMARKLISYLDDSMSNLAPTDVIASGDPAEAVGALTQARTLWRTQAKSSLIDDLLSQAKNQASRSNSGGNLQNAVRQKLSKILDQPKLRRMFDTDELAAVQQLVDGSTAQNLMRTIGRLAPSSNSWIGPLMTSMGLSGAATAAGGGLSAAAAGIAVPVIGAAAKFAGTRSTLNEANAISKLVRSAAVPKAAQVPLTPSSVAQITARILSQGTGSLNSPYARALLQQYGAGGVPAIAGPGTGSQNQP